MFPRSTLLYRFRAILSSAKAVFHSPKLAFEHPKHPDMKEHTSAQHELNQELEVLEGELASRVAQASGKILELKRLRNEISPIGCLPADVLCTLFLVVIDLPDQEWPFENDNIASGPLGGSVTLCHVSYAWRKIALGFPLLWSRIHAKQNTSAHFLRFVLDNAAPAPVCLEYSHTRTNLPKSPWIIDPEIIIPNTRPRAFNTIRRALCNVAQLRGITLLKLEHSLLQQMLPLDEFPPRSDVLEDIHIELYLRGWSRSAGDSPASFPHLHILEAGATRLRTLKLLNCVVSWPPGGPLMYPSRLTTLSVRVPQGTSFAQVHGVLVQAIHLEELCLKLHDMFDATLWGDVQPPSGRTTFAYLQRLVMHGPTQAVTSLLDQMAVPIDIRRTTIGCYPNDGMNPPHPAPAMAAFEAARSVEPPGQKSGITKPHPVKMVIDNRYVTHTTDEQWSNDRIPACLCLFFEEESTTELQELPSDPAADSEIFRLFTVETFFLLGQHVDEAVVTAAFPLEFFSSAPTSTRCLDQCGWSLANLQDFESTTHTTTALWDMLVYLPQLLVITVDWEQARLQLIPQLRRNDSQPDTGGSRSHSESVGGSRGPSYRLPFPALSVLQITTASPDCVREVTKALDERLTRAQTLLLGHAHTVRSAPVESEPQENELARLGEPVTPSEDTPRRIGMLDELQLKKCMQAWLLTEDDIDDFHKVALEVWYSRYEHSDTTVPFVEIPHDSVDDSEDEDEVVA